MYKVHPRNLTLGPFLTLLFTLGRKGRISAGLTDRGADGCRLSEAVPANAHEGALNLEVTLDGRESPPTVTKGPFLKLILAMCEARSLKIGRTKEPTSSIGTFCRKTFTR